MKWMTLAHVHLDRVATPWLIRRFVDADAEFLFAEWGAALHAEEDTILFGIPGVELGLHDDAGTLFAKVLRAYSLDDPALWKLERIVAAGVRRALGHARPRDETAEESRLGAALDTFGQGLAMAYDDHEHIESALPLYEALYTLCRWCLSPDDVRQAAPGMPPERLKYIRGWLAGGAER